MPSIDSVQRTQVLALRIDNHLNRQRVTTVQRDIVVEERVDQLNAFGSIQRDVRCTSLRTFGSCQPGCSLSELPEEILGLS
jgi:hypothetical protein